MSQSAPCLFVKYENIRSFLNPLKAVVFNDKAKMCYAVIQADANGLRVTVEHGKAAQAVAFLEAQSCDQFLITSDEPLEIKFAIDLLSLIRFLDTGIFPHATSTFNSGPVGSATLRLTYDPKIEKALEVHLECPTFSTRLRMKTIANCDLQMESYDELKPDLIARVILQCDALKEAFVDLDISSEYLTITTSADPAYFRFSTTSRLTSSHVDFNAGATVGSNSIVQLFSCRDSTSHKYKMSLFRAALRAMVFGHRVSVRLSVKGLLSLQFQLPTLPSGDDGEFDDSCYTYVDYTFCSVDEL